MFVLCGKNVSKFLSVGNCAVAIYALESESRIQAGDQTGVNLLLKSQKWPSKCCCISM